MCQRFFAVIAALAMFASSSAVTKSAEARTSKSAKPQIEVCFVLDTTGSMSGLIEGAKQKIWSIANEMISAKPTPEIKFGLIGYRDRGDEYVTKVFNLTDDIDDIYAHLQSFQAAGGGDTPESVNEALDDAVSKLTWSTNRSVLKIMFLVGDAPPHMDYGNGPKYPDVCKAAMKCDLIINTIQCGMMGETTPIWKEIAQLSEGSYAAIGQTGNKIAIATPMDKELAELNRKIGTTLVAYGDESARRFALTKQVASEAAPASVAADRLRFNSASGKAIQGGGELLDAVANGSVKLDSVPKSKLPTELQKLNAEELKAYVGKQQKQRAELQDQIRGLNEKRQTYIDAEKKRLAAKGNADAFDEKVAEMIRAQAAEKGIEYGK
ncbi:MAG: VWA domain-containing protein [Verrucomicrobia bacterium]|nr:VWA domain-containing protein [Verrucomicrobiota bacterium]